jgi:hypothetical protein
VGLSAAPEAAGVRLRGRGLPRQRVSGVQPGWPATHGAFKAAVIGLLRD